MDLLIISSLTHLRTIIQSLMTLQLKCQKKFTIMKLVINLAINQLLKQTLEMYNYFPILLLVQYSRMCSFFTQI